MVEKILIVDDEPKIRLLIEKILSDYDVITAASGRELWQILDTEYPSLVMLDVIMPDENGFEIAKKMSQNEKLKNIPIIFVTAKIAGQDVEEGFSSGGYDYIKKPFDPVELRARVKAVIQKKMNELKLREESQLDPLTRIFNRGHFTEVAQQQIEYYKRHKNSLSLSMIDIDKFKKINDTYGHPVGDFVLKEFAQLLLKNIRPFDLLARYGGEEFIIMFLDCNKKDSKTIVDRILDCLQKETYTCEHAHIRFNFSAGISDVEDSFDQPITLEELIKIADQRLYRAKGLGGNTVVIAE